MSLNVLDIAIWLEASEPALFRAFGCVITHELTVGGVCTVTIEGDAFDTAEQAGQAVAGILRNVVRFETVGGAA